MHWSERELHEPIYNDDVVSAAAKKDQTPNSTGKVGCLPDVSSNPSSRPRRRTGGISREASYQIATLDAEYDAISRQLELVLRSTSWKISAPIRMVVRRVPMLARLSRTILGPFWRWMYIVLRRREPVVTRRSAGLKAPPLDAMARFKRLQSRPGRDVVLVAADAPPMFDKQSGGLRLYNLIRIFCEMDCRVVFVSQCGQDYFTGIAGSAEQQKRYEGLLYAAGVERVVYGPEEAEYLIRELGSELSWAFLSFPNVADQFIPRIRAHAPWATVMYDMVDFHSLRKSREANLRSDAALQAEAERMRQIELTNAKAADVTVAISDSERQQLLAIDPNLVVEVIPNVFDLPINARLQIDGSERIAVCRRVSAPPKPGRSVVVRA